ncbi:MAG: bifunctional heptose 7-phosphate kinase/heptose 1-phosphate adenyltransferase [Planctomycetota bacterium]
MNLERLRAITDRYRNLTVAVLGDFCLDRYLEIDPALGETSIETGLPVHNVVRVRAQPGAAGTVLNNLVALGVGRLLPVGFCGDDGEGFELRRAMGRLAGVELNCFLQTPERQTFTYCKPLVCEPGRLPKELNRLDSKNWTPTPPQVEQHLIDALGRIAPELHALIVMDQVDVAETGAVTRRVLEALGAVAREHPRLAILADSRRSLRDYPAVLLKMNRAELGMLRGGVGGDTIKTVAEAARELSRRHGREVFVTLAEDGMLAASPDGAWVHRPALAVRGPIDIVGAGDSVTANLAVALAAGATLEEAIELASAAASVVIHQLGTTGTATVAQITEVLGLGP